MKTLKYKNTIGKILIGVLGFFMIFAPLEAIANANVEAGNATVKLDNLVQVTGTNNVNITYTLNDTATATALYFCDSGDQQDPPGNVDCFDALVPAGSVLLKTGTHTITINDFDLKLPPTAYNANGKIELKAVAQYGPTEFTHSQTVQNLQFTVIPRPVPTIDITSAVQQGTTTNVLVTYKYDIKEYVNATFQFEVINSSGGTTTFTPSVINNGDGTYSFYYDVGDYNPHTFKITIFYPLGSVNDTQLATMQVKKTPLITTFGATSPIVDSHTISNINGIVDLKDYLIGEVAIEVYLDSDSTPSLSGLLANFSGQSISDVSYDTHTLTLVVKELNGPKVFDTEVIPVKLLESPTLDVKTAVQQEKTTNVKVDFNYDVNSYPAASLTYFMDGNPINPTVTYDAVTGNAYFIWDAVTFGNHSFEVVLTYDDPAKTLSDSASVTLVKKVEPIITSLTSNNPIIDETKITNIDGVVNLNEYLQSEVSIKLYLDNLSNLQFSGLLATFNDYVIDPVTYGIHNLILVVQDKLGITTFDTKNAEVKVLQTPSISMETAEQQEKTTNVKVDFSYAVNSYADATIAYYLDDLSNPINPVVTNEGNGEYNFIYDVGDYEAHTFIAVVTYDNASKTKSDDIGVIMAEKIKPEITTFTAPALIKDSVDITDIDGVVKLNDYKWEEVTILGYIDNIQTPVINPTSETFNNASILDAGYGTHTLILVVKDKSGTTLASKTIEVVLKETPELNVVSATQVDKTTEVQVDFTYDKNSYPDAVLTYSYDNNGNEVWTPITPNVVYDGDNKYHFIWDVGDYGIHDFKVDLTYQFGVLSDQESIDLEEKIPPVITLFTAPEKIIDSTTIDNIDGAINLNDYELDELKISIYIDGLSIDTLTSLPDEIKDKIINNVQYGPHVLTLVVKDLEGNVLDSKEVPVTLKQSPEIIALDTSTVKNDTTIGINYEVDLNDYPDANVYFLINGNYYSEADVKQFFTTYEAPKPGTYTIELVVEYADGQKEKSTVATVVVEQPAPEEPKEEPLPYTGNVLSPFEDWIMSIQSFLIEAFGSAEQFFMDLQQFIIETFGSVENFTIELQKFIVENFENFEDTTIELIEYFQNNSQDIYTSE